MAWCPVRATPVYGCTFTSTCPRAGSPSAPNTEILYEVLFIGLSSTQFFTASNFPADTVTRTAFSVLKQIRSG